MARLFVAVLVVGVWASAFGQSKPPVKPKPAAPGARATTTAKPAAPKPKYLSAPFDVNLSNLGPDFQGHDIEALYTAVEKSPALEPKSEFETTTQFEARRKAFADQPLFAGTAPGGVFAFVVANDFAKEFKYDADSQTLAFTLNGHSKTFYGDPGNPALDTVEVRNIIRSTDSYIGSNAFGAQVKVDKTFAEDYGIGFGKEDWLFHSSDDSTRKFTHLFQMTSDQARAIKMDVNVLLVCRLVYPWFRHSAHGHKATIDEPYELTVGDNFLQVVPEQLWIFNQKTGEVISKLSESLIAAAQDQQLSIKLKQTPLILEVSSSQLFTYRLAVDSQPEESEHFSGGTVKSFSAQRRIVFTVDYPNNLAEIRFKVNGKSYTPEWRKDSTKIGSYESVRSATVTINVPLPGGASGASAAPAASNPEGRALLAKVIEAYGGAAKLNAVRTTHRKAAITLKAQGVTMEVEEYSVGEDKSYLKANTPSGPMAMVATPQSGFISMAALGAPRDMPASQRSDTLKNLHRRGWYIAQHAADPQFAFVAQGKQTIGGAEATILDISYGDERLRWFVDEHTSHVVRAQFQATGPSGPITQVVDYSDFRTVDGMTVPFHEELSADGKPNATAAVKSVEFNVAVDQKIFEKPQP